MPSFDIVNKLDMQEVDNAVNITKKMVTTRYDFRGSKSQIDFLRKDSKINILTEDNMKMKAIESELSTNLAKRQIDLKALKYGDVETAAHDMIRCAIDIQEGIDTDTAKKIVKKIKGEKIKVQAQIQDEQVRVSGKKIDDLQAVISLLKEQDFGVPLQFVNMRS